MKKREIAELSRTCLLQALALRISWQIQCDSKPRRSVIPQERRLGAFQEGSRSTPRSQRNYFREPVRTGSFSKSCPYLLGSRWICLSPSTGSSTTQGVVSSFRTLESAWPWETKWKREESLADYLCSLVNRFRTGATWEQSKNWHATDHFDRARSKCLHQSSSNRPGNYVNLHSSRSLSPS